MTKKLILHGSKNLFLTIFLILIIFGTSSYALVKADSKNDQPLIVFHIDLNSVALKKDYIEKWLKKAADMGYNAVLWELEDKVRWETCPECVNEEAFTKKEFKEILAYSRSLGLEPIPLLQTIGHAEYVLQHKKYYKFREDSARYDCYCTSKPEVRRFIKNWIKEYLDLFGDIKYFHLGGDEAYAFATDSLCSAEAAKIGKGNLYAEYVKDIAQPLLEKNIRPGIWCDMILHYYEGLKSIPKSFVIWDWNYWDGDKPPYKVMVWHKGQRLGKERITDDIKNIFPRIVDDEGNPNPFYTADYLKDHGFSVILASSSRSYGDGVFAGREELHTENIIGAAKKTVAANLLGTCVTSWAVRIPSYETQATWLYLAPLTIEKSNLSHDELIAHSQKYIFGFSNSKLTDAFSLTGFSFPFANEKSTGIMWTGLKDSRPAPPGFIKHYVEKLKSSEDKWNSAKILVENSTGKISDGINLLNKIIPQAEKGINVLDDWSKAGYFQYWQSIIANELIKNEEGKNHLKNSEVVSLLKIFAPIMNNGRKVG